ncbi:hypothetical protein FHT03_000252 [Xanthomonas arboricola]|nr:hypothetical protein [Xanthomonas cannabis]
MGPCRTIWANLTLAISALLVLSACDGPADNIAGRANGHAVITAELIQKSNVTTELLKSETLDDGTSIQCLGVDYDEKPGKRHGPIRAIWRQKAEGGSKGAASGVIWEKPEQSDEQASLFAEYCPKP